MLIIIIKQIPTESIRLYTCEMAKIKSMQLQQQWDEANIAVAIESVWTHIDVIGALECEIIIKKKEKVFAAGVAFEPAHTLTFRVVKRINREGEFGEDVTSSFFLFDWARTN